jgi:hypothetical protein
MLRLVKFQPAYEVIETGEIILQFGRILARVEFIDLRIDRCPEFVRSKIESDTTVVVCKWVNES